MKITVGKLFLLPILPIRGLKMLKSIILGIQQFTLTALPHGLQSTVAKCWMPNQPLTAADVIPLMWMARETSYKIVPLEKGDMIM